MMPASDSTACASAITPTASSTSMVLPFSSFSVSPARPQRTTSLSWILSRSKMCDGRPVLEHHVVRDVDQRRDAALAAAGQAVDHPLRRGRRVLTLAHHAPEKRPHRSGPAPRRAACRHAPAAPGRWAARQRRTGQRRHSRAMPYTLSAWPRLGVSLSVKTVSSSASTSRMLAPTGRRRPAPAGRRGRRSCPARAPSTACPAFHAAQLAELDQEGLAVLSRRQFAPTVATAP
jgi:hypothetical protein